VAPEPIARRLLISGRVQGVWFRQSCRRQAAIAGVAGWARNLADGRVEVWLEGEADAVARMVAWCHTGPPRAVVTSVHVEEVVPEHDLGFRTD
jgi:acylphosphatase